ncbi:MAG: hypothetical protein ACKVWV_18760 [Planctomycetota bacterium]
MSTHTARRRLQDLDRRLRELLVAVRDPDADVGAVWRSLEPHALSADALRRMIAEAPEAERESVESDVRALSELVAVALGEARRERALAGAAIDRLHAANQTFAFYRDEGDACDVAG